MNEPQPPSEPPAPPPEPQPEPSPQPEPAPPARRRRTAKPKVPASELPAVETPSELAPLAVPEPAPARELPLMVLSSLAAPVEQVPRVLPPPPTSAELQAPPPAAAPAPQVLASAVPPSAPPPPPPPPAPVVASAAPVAPVGPPRRWREHFWAILSHVLLFLAIPTIFLGGVFTFFLWQIAGKNDPFVEDQAREALNFQINVAILTVLLALSFIGLPLVIVTWIIACVMCLIGALHAARGERYRYPIVLRIVTH